ncbi:MAG: hypothetical protein AAGJ84_10035 [Pseudomonadota bacterium]
MVEKLALSLQKEDNKKDAPAYVIGKQIFVDREHLPWVQDLVRNST